MVNWKGDQLFDKKKIWCCETQFLFDYNLKMIFTKEGIAERE